MLLRGLAMIEHRISAHLAWLRTMDEDYAKWARANYVAILVTPFKR